MQPFMTVLQWSVKCQHSSVMGRQDPDSEILGSRGSSQIQILIPFSCFISIWRNQFKQILKHKQVDLVSPVAEKMSFTKDPSEQFAGIWTCHREAPGLPVPAMQINNYHEAISLLLFGFRSSSSRSVIASPSSATPCGFTATSSPCSVWRMTRWGHLPSTFMCGGRAGVLYQRALLCVCWLQWMGCCVCSRKREYS